MFSLLKKKYIIFGIILVLLIKIFILLWTYKKYTKYISPISENFTNKNRNMVFTSCGDNTNFHNLWCGVNRNYDIYAIYYGNNNVNFNLYQSKVDFIEKRKGSKFQNFHYFYNKNPEIINKYDRFFILDDDIIFTSDDINKMFDISKKYDLVICGPTFKKKGSKISHGITIQQKDKYLRYVNFIEVNVPLFNRVAIDNLMKYYDPVLIGWGVDYLAIWANGQNSKDKYALVDAVSCINPHDKKKNNKRELLGLERANRRMYDWKNFKNKLNIKEWKHKTYSFIPK